MTMMSTRFKALDKAEDRLDDLRRDEEDAYNAVIRAESQFGTDAYETVQARRRYAQIAVRKRDQEKVVTQLGGVV